MPHRGSSIDLDRQVRHERGRTVNHRRTTSRPSSSSESWSGSRPASTELPRLIEGRDDYRVLIGAGTLVSGFAVIGQLANDGALELVQFDADTDTDW